MFYSIVGASTKYVPLSIQAPEYYKQLQEQQARYNDAQAWWPCMNAPTHWSSSLDSDDVVKRHTPGLNAPYTSHGLQEELLSAISSPLTPQTQTPHVQHLEQANTDALVVKTSETHPIK